MKKGRASRPNIKLGICGEHGGDPASIQFFEKVGLDYVSCSPYRVPVARLGGRAGGAAGQGRRLIKVYVNQDGHDRPADRVDPAWLAAGQRQMFWVDLRQPDTGEGRILTDVFHFHDLAVEDALSAIHHPKVESYGDYLYLIVHRHRLRGDEAPLRDPRRRLLPGLAYLVTIHSGDSRSIERIPQVCDAQRHRCSARGRRR